MLPSRILPLAMTSDPPLSLRQPPRDLLPLKSRARLLLLQEVLQVRERRMRRERRARGGRGGAARRGLEQLLVLVVVAVHAQQLPVAAVGRVVVVVAVAMVDGELAHVLVRELA